MTEKIDPETGEVLEEEAPVQGNVPASVDQLMSQDFATWFPPVSVILNEILEAIRKYKGAGDGKPDIGTIRNSMRIFAGYLGCMPGFSAQAETFAILKEDEFMRAQADSKLSPTVMKKRAEAYAHKEIQVKNWIDGLHKDLSKILDAARSDLSFEREQLREHDTF